MPKVPRAEHFSHAADIGVRGVGRTREEAFAQAALALSAVVTDIAGIGDEISIAIECEAPNDQFLLVDWLNALIYRMSLDRMVFGRFEVAIEGHRLKARAWGEHIDRARHAPAVEPKGATYTALKVERDPGGTWLAQCVVDV